MFFCAESGLDALKTGECAAAASLLSESFNSPWEDVSVGREEREVAKEVSEINEIPSREELSPRDKEPRVENGERTSASSKGE